MQQLGRYQILKQLGAGGFGAVYLAHDPVIKRDVAIKVFQPKDDNLIAFATSTNTEGLDVLRTRFQQEAEILAQLDDAHHVVSVLDSGESEDGAPYYVMPYLKQSLADLLGKDVFDKRAIAELPSHQQPKALDYPTALAYFEQILEGMNDAHSVHLVHRDIKPGNIMLSDKGQIKIVDFGIAKAPDGGHSTVSHLGMGSRNYMAPEQRESAKHVDTRADVYSLGVLAYRMFTGRLPQGRYADPNIACPQLPSSLNTLILSALNDDIDARPNDATAMLVAFKAAKDEAVNPPEGGEGTGTWVGGTEGNEVKTELKPLQDIIRKSFTEYGEITPKTQKAIDAMVALVDIDDEALAAFITSQQNQLASEDKTLGAFIDFVSRINQLATSNKTIDAEQVEVMANTSTASTGKTVEALTAIITNKCKVGEVKTSEESSSPPKTPHIDKTAIPKQPEQPTTKSNSNKKWLVAGAVALALGGGGYYGFTEYQAAQLAEAQARENQARARAAQQAAASERKAQILNAQTQLLQLGYQVIQNGELDTRTQRAIEAFEQNEGMIVTGEVDEVLLEGLTKAITREDADAWVTASNTNTQASYQTYLALWSTGSYIEQANQSIADLKAAAEATANDSRAWQTAQQTNSIAGYQAYLTNQPSGAYRNQAQNNINAIELENSKVALSITTTPADATVQIMNIEQPFQNGMRLVPGNYEVKISRVGYTTQSHTVRLSVNNRSFSYQLKLALLGSFVNIPSGNFVMGSNSGHFMEKPEHRVSVAAFRLMTTEVTWDMYQPCIDAGVCPNNDSDGGDYGWGKGNRPVIEVSLNDITQHYIPWLNQQTGQQFRLPTEAEWEYAARAGSTSKYHFGYSASQLCDYANGEDLSSIQDSRNTNCNDGYGDQTAPAASFEPNAFGLYDMFGNVWELTQDCWHNNYQGAPTNGSAWMNSNSGRCHLAVIRGGGWDSDPDSLRSTYRQSTHRVARNHITGFRLAQDAP